MHEYTVEFRILGKDLVPSEITADLDLQPNLVRQLGEEKGGNAFWEEALWAYDGYSTDGEVTWNSLEEGLRFVLDKLWPLRDKIDGYRTRFQLILWCGHFYSSFNGGPTLSPDLLKLLAEFGVELFIDNYCFDEKAGDSDEGT